MLLIRSLAEALDLSFKRIQFTPDLMPSDNTGDIAEDRRAPASLGFCRGRCLRTYCWRTRSTARRRDGRQCCKRCRSARSVSAGRPTRAGVFCFHTRNLIEQEGVPVAGGGDGPVHAVDPGELPDGRRGDRRGERDDGVDSPELSPVLSGAEALRSSGSSGRCRSRTSSATPCCRPTPADRRAGDRHHPWHVRFGAGPRASQYLGPRAGRIAGDLVSLTTSARWQGRCWSIVLCTSRPDQWGGRGRTPGDPRRQRDGQRTQQVQTPPAINDKLRVGRLAIAAMCGRRYLRLHRSARRGSSPVFEAHRPYGGGPKVGRPRVWAKTDQLYIREYEQETNLRGYLV